MEKLSFDVKVEENKGLRYGVFNMGGIKSHFPTHAITSTNLNHATSINKSYSNHITPIIKSDFNFGTDFLDIIEFKPKEIMDVDLKYRKYRISVISKIIKNNPQKHIFLALSGIKTESSFQITKEFNESFIKFQYECGFKFIKVYFNSEENIIKDSEYYRKLIPSDRIFVAVIDENLRPDIFNEFYSYCCDNKKDKIIAFFGQTPSKIANNHIKINFEFLSKRKNDQILRLTSFTEKKINSVISSLSYYSRGIDVYSFRTNRGPASSNNFEALEKFTYRIIDSNSKLTCVITGKNLHQSFHECDEIGILKIHDIVEFNKLLKTIYKDYTIDEIQEISNGR